MVQPENGEWTFFVYNGDLQDTSQTLLRIRVYSAKDYHDKFDGDYFQLIGQKGLFEKAVHFAFAVSRLPPGYGFLF